MPSPDIKGKDDLAEELQGAMDTFSPYQINKQAEQNDNILLRSLDDAAT